MATYQELVAINQNDVLRQKIKMAVAVTAVAITAEAGATPNHAQRLAWAKAALGNPDGEVERIVWHVLGTYAALDAAAITGAADADVLTAVQSAVNLFAS